MIQVFHNNRCSKSRCALDTLTDAGKAFETVEYLINPPTEKELKTILKKLKMKPEDLVRKGEAVFKEKFAGKSFSDEEWLKILTDNPILIERPIIINGNKAVIGRPVENILTIL